MFRKLDHRNFFGFGFIILSTAALIHAVNFAHANPTGPSISLGGNPTIASGGTISNGSVTLFTAPTDQMIIITDLILTMNSDDCRSSLIMSTTSGNVLSQTKLHSNYGSINSGSTHQSRAALTTSQPSSIQHSFGSGLPIPINESLEISETGGCNIAYTLTGYYAEP